MSHKLGSESLSLSYIKGLWGISITQVEKRLDEIRAWHKNGRPETFSEPNSFSEQPKFQMALDLLKQRKINKLLDVGCYTGYWLRNLKEMGYQNLSGCDLQRTMMPDIGKGLGLDMRFCSAETLEEEWDDNTFDCITLFDVLEHVLDLDLVLKQIHKVAKKGALIIIHLPSITKNYKDESHEHVRMFTLPQIERTFPEAVIWSCKDENNNPSYFIWYELRKI